MSCLLERAERADECGALCSATLEDHVEECHGVLLWETEGLNGEPAARIARATPHAGQRDDVPPRPIPTMGDARVNVNGQLVPTARRRRRTAVSGRSRAPSLLESAGRIA